MTTTSLQSTGCVSLATGTIRTDERVNYEYGMVLGVDDFRTEQQHRLELDYRHERALHGFGTVYGLEVTLADADAGDAVVTVEPGMMIDQFGREAVIGTAQCARVGAWLAAQEQATPGTVASHRDGSGGLTLYVVARYSSCLDALVPLPGTPCSTSSANSVPSRIRDAWEMDLSLTPPAMPRWDTDRRLARLLGHVRIVADLPHGQSDEQLIINAALDLPAQVAGGPDDLVPPNLPPGGVFQLPADEAADALDRILTVWVTRIRPLLAPALGDPAGSQAGDGAPDPGALAEQHILLSMLHVLPADPFEVSQPVISAYDEPDDAGRPYLLHTSLIQQLGVLNAEAAAVHPVEFVQLSPSVDADGLLVIDAWFPLGHDVGLAGTVQVGTETGERHEFSAGATDADGNAVEFAQRWELTAPEGFTAVDAQTLRVTLDGEQTLIDDADTTLRELQRSGVTLVNSRVDGSVAAYTTVQIDPVVEPQPPSQQAMASVDFLTVNTTTENVKEGQLGFELWFHPQPRGRVDDVLVVEKPAVEFFDEITGNPLEIVSMDQHPNYRNVWWVVTGFPDNEVSVAAYVRLVIHTRKTLVNVQGGDTMPLADWIEKAQILFVGWDLDEQLIVAFARNGQVGVLQ